MPSVRYAIDASGATRGAQQWAAATDRIVAEARRAAQAVEVLDRTLRSAGQGNVGREIDRVAGQLGRIPGAARPAAAEVNTLTQSMRNMSSAAALSFGPLSGLGSRFTAVGSLATRNSVALGGAIAAVTGIGVAFGASVRAAADFEAAMLRVAKVTNASNGELQRMSADTLRLSSTLGIPAGELAKIEQGAAQLGVRGTQNLAAFAEQVAMLTRTSDLGAEQATQSLARLLNITGESTSNIAGMAAALTDLGNKSAASESQILSMALELGRGTAAFNVSSQQILALGAALSEVGEKSERSATAVSQVFIAITDAAAGGDNLQAFADVLGITTQRFQELAQKDIGAVFQRLLGVLAQQGPAAVATLRDLEIGSSRNTKVLLSLAEVLDKYQRNLGLVAEQYRNPTAAADEFARMNDSVSRQVEIAGVQLTNIATTLGAAFLPAINDTLQGLNAFLLLLQDIEPKAGTAGVGVRALADAVKFLGDIMAKGTSWWAVFETDIDRALKNEDVLAHLRELHKLASTPAELFPNADENVRVLSSAVSVLNGELNASRVDDFAAAFPPLASSIDGVADSAIAAGEAVSKMGRAVNSTLADLQQQINLKTIEIEQGKAAAETQKIVNDLQKDGGKVTDEQRAAILALAQANENLDNRMRGVSRAHKEVEKAAKDSEKAHQALKDELAGLGRDLDRELSTIGLTENEKAVVELTAKYEELRAKAVEGGADEVQAREDVNRALEEGIQKQDEINAAKGREFQDDTLAGVREQIELRQIENSQGAAAAETQRVLNEAKREGIQVDAAFADQLRASNEELDSLQEKSSVVADAFEDFITGIAQGTQDLSLDGISDAFKAAFAASVKEKLKFDEIFKGNLFDLVEYAKDIFSSGVVKVGGLFSFDDAGGSGGGGGGGGGFFDKLGGLFSGGGGGSGSGSGGGSGGGGLEIIGQNADGSYIYADGSEGYGQSIPGGGTTGGGGSGFSTGLANAATGAVTAYSLFRGASEGDTKLQGLIARGTESGVISAANNIGQIFGTIVGAVASIYLGPIGGLIGAVAGSGLTALITASVDRKALLKGHLTGPMEALADPLRGGLWDASGSGVMLGALVNFLISLPTLGLAMRKGAESMLDNSETFKGAQARFGDITVRSGGPEGVYRNNLTGADTALERGFTEEQVRLTKGATAAIFNQLAEGEFAEDAGRLGEAMGNIMAEFLSRGLEEGVEFEETFDLLRQFAREAGVDIMTTMRSINDVMTNSIAAGERWGKLDPMAAAEQGARAYAEALVGATEVFRNDYPQGVNLASIALRNFEKDGVNAFGEIDTKARDTLFNLAKDTALTTDIIEKLVAQGFTIDTEEFERQLSAISQSAALIGKDIGNVFNFDDAAVGVQAIFQSLKGQIYEVFSKESVKQLFDSTNIASAFEPVFAVLDRIDEFDLTTATGSQEFMGQLLPALAQGKANLQDYIPILQLMADNWKEIQKIIDEAMKPDVFEQAALIAEEGFNGIGGALSSAITAGLDVLEDGGTWDQAVNVFRSTFGTGVQQAFKDAIFNGIVQASVIEPLIARYQPAFQYVVAAGLIHGFGDKRVQEALALLMGQAQKEAEELGLAVFSAKVDSEGITSDIERAFNDAAPIAVEWADSLKSTIHEGLNAAFDVLAEGGSRDAALKAWGDALGSNTRDSVFRGIVLALIDASIIEPFIKQWAPIVQYWTAAGLALAPGDSEARRRWEEAGRDLFGPNSPFMQGLNNIGPIAIDFYGRINGLEDANGNPIDAGSGIGLDLNGSQTGSGRTTPGRSFPGAARGGVFGIGESFIVGENGPEFVRSGPNGIEVTPLSATQASALLDPASTQGRTFPPGGDGRTFPTNPTNPGGRDQPRNPIDVRPGGRDDDFTNPTTRPRVPPPPGQHPGSTGAGAVTVEVSLGIDDAIGDFLRGGSLKDFQDAIDEASKKAVLDGLIKGMLASGPIKSAIDAFNKQMSDAVTMAMRDGVIDAKEQADLDALGSKLAGNIEAATKSMQPAVAALGGALGLGVAGSVNSSVKSGLEGAFREFAETGDIGAARDAVRDAFAEATISGIVDALLVEGPIAEAIESASGAFGDAMSAALEDGVISQDEADHLRELGAQLGTDLETAFTGLDPVITGLFDGMREKATAAMQQAGDLIGGSLRGLLNDPQTLNFQSFSASLRQAIYQEVAGGLIDAFVDAAIVQGALAPMLAAIQLIFEQIGKHQISIAEANGAIATQIALMLDVLKDPAFKEAIDTLLKGVTDIGKQLDAFAPAAGAAAAAAGLVSDAVTQAQEDVCAGKCGLKEETTNLGQTVLDASGRIGEIEDIVFRSQYAGGTAADDRALASTLGGGDGSYGFLGDDADWRRAQRWHRREARNGGEPGYYGPDPVPTNSGASTQSAPLGDSGDDDVIDLLEELIGEVKALAQQPVIVNGEVKVGEDKVIDVMMKAKRTARAAGFPL